MNEEEVQIKRRQNEEDATARHARIIGLPYLDTRNFERDEGLIRDVLTKEEMHKNFIIPRQVGEGSKPYEFMVTSQTPRSVIGSLQKKYDEELQTIMTPDQYKAYKADQEEMRRNFGNRRGGGGPRGQRN